MIKGGSKSAQEREVNWILPAISALEIYIPAHCKPRTAASNAISLAKLSICVFYSTLPSITVVSSAEFFCSSRFFCTEIALVDVDGVTARHSKFVRSYLGCFSIALILALSVTSP